MAAEAAMQRFDTYADVFFTHARVAMLKADWGEAVRRWTLMEERFPGHPTAARMRLRCLGQFLSTDAPAARIALDAKAMRRAANLAGRLQAGRPEALTHFLMGFESLGPNCEFGFLQKSFGAEPLGLLRWAGSSRPGLLAALRHRFQGVGAPEQTRLELKNGLYFARDTRFQLLVHTGIREGAMAPETLLAKQCKRMAFLRDRLLAELSSQAKIFAYAPYQLDEADMALTARLLQSYGSNTLLCIRLAEAGHEAGSLETDGRGLVVGYAAREGWSFEEGHQRWHIDREQWLTFLAAAWQVRAGLVGPFPSPGG
jgi:hypothetical protein